MVENCIGRWLRVKRQSKVHTVAYAAMPMTQPEIFQDVPLRTADALLDDLPIDLYRMVISKGVLVIPASVSLHVKIVVKGKKRTRLREVPIELRIPDVTELHIHDYKLTGDILLGEIRKEDPLHVRLIDVQDTESGFTVASPTESLEIYVGSESLEESNAFRDALQRAEEWLSGLRSVRRPQSGQREDYDDSY